MAYPTLRAGELDMVDWPAVETPCYLYDAAVLEGRIRLLTSAFEGLFRVSYAVKSNPNAALLARIAGLVPHVDASSAHEVERALAAGVAPERITWSGPGKRAAELRAIAGRGVTIVAEAEDEIELLGRICADRPVRQPVLLRINPDHVPKGFGASMSGKPSQFGVDQDRMGDAIDRILALPQLDLAGFHAYTGSMCLEPEPIAGNIANLCGIFRAAATHAGIRPRKLVFGAGFGIPYHAGQGDLDIAAVRALVEPHIRALAASPDLGGAERLLELGRWITGPAGALVTGVLSVKESRGLGIAVCDAGFNNHLAACGMMGSVFQKNYPIVPLRRSAAGPEAERPRGYMLAGPLCTSIDQLARRIELPELRRGDLLAVLMSGAYGLTASPTRFISHPEPAEYLLEDGRLTDISESRLNRLGSRVPELAQ